MITSKDNSLVKEVSRLISSSRERRIRGQFVAEGLRLCTDAVSSGAAVVSFLYTPQAREREPEVFGEIAAASERSYEISPEIMERISDTEHPQGFLCVISSASGKKLDEIKKNGRYAALENISDPSNLGTILRTAEALGIDGVILSRGCCDIYSPKVVRGSMGAVFRVPFRIEEDLTRFIADRTAAGINTYASTPRDAGDIAGCDLSGGGIMLIGNEANGLREETIRACSCRVRINMKGRAESLNASAAAAILLYEMLRGE